MWQLGECRWRAFADYLSANGVPARVVNVPGTAPSYELYGTAHLQRTLKSDG